MSKMGLTMLVATFFTILTAVAFIAGDFNWKMRGFAIVLLLVATWFWTKLWVQLKAFNEGR